jgi:hypothetical protein
MRVYFDLAAITRYGKEADTFASNGPSSAGRDVPAPTLHLAANTKVLILELERCHASPVVLDCSDSLAGSKRNGNRRGVSVVGVAYQLFERRNETRIDTGEFSEDASSYSTDRKV